jgi:flagellar basal-body rod modification protein FlgD
MDLSQLNSIATPGTSAAGAVASALAPRRAAVQATPKDSTSSTNGTSNSSSSSASSSASDSSDITANDFLTLLVSELQNQDPTQPTDPNQYITQLTQVNSLQQLIQLNQTTQLGDGDSVALLNDIDLTVNPSSTIATPPSSSGSNSGSGSNADVVAKTKEMASIDPLPSMQSVAGQGTVWGGSVSS